MARRMPRACNKVVIAIPSIRDPKRTREVYEEHREIITAVAARDVNGARRTISGHLIGATLRWFPCLQPFPRDDMNNFFQVVVIDIPRSREDGKRSEK